LRRFSLMKIGSKIRIAGVHTPPAGRNAGKLCSNGCGIYVWSWDSTSRLPRCG
jgi:hypothetical protein